MKAIYGPQGIQQEGRTIEVNQETGSVPCEHGKGEGGKIHKEKQKTNIGKKYGCLTAICKSLPDKKGRARWQYKCDCGNVKIMPEYNVRNGKSKSCGCVRDRIARERATIHGGRLTPEYGIWCGMKARCYNPKSIFYKDYGGRGIKICKKWRNDFSAFISDMGHRPSPLHSIDRVKNDGNYSAGNCRWATQKQQCNNKRGNKLLTFQGQTKTMMEWSEFTGISYDVISQRLRLLKWDIEKALTKPTRKIKCHHNTHTT